MMKMNNSSTGTKIVLRVMIDVLFLSEVVVSQSIINTLPGYQGKLPFKLETGLDLNPYELHMRLPSEKLLNQLNQLVVNSFKVILGSGKLKMYVHLFYYFVESERNPLSNPLIIWLAGGPGCSTLIGFFYGIGNEDGNETPVNIKGYMIGNPVTDKMDESNSVIKYAHRMALISDELDKCLSKINAHHILEPKCDRKDSSNSGLSKGDGGSFEDNPIFMGTWCRENYDVFLSMWAKDKTVQKALQIREGTIREWTRCNPTMQNALGKNASISYAFDVTSTVDFHQNLISKKCRALIFRVKLGLS
ncbi:hypothetical protein LguiB_022008 [Lonicera macranthoides]